MSNPKAPGRVLFIGHSGSQAYVWHSDDGGASYQLSDTAKINVSNEAQLAELPDGRVVANMRHQPPRACKCRAVAVSDVGGTSFGSEYYSPQLISPVCNAAILRGPPAGSARNALFFANPASERYKTNGTVRRSDDGGHTWSHSLFVGSPFDYSSLSLTANPDALGLLWETWEPVGGKHCNGEACSVVFSTIPVAFVDNNGGKSSVER